MILKGLFMKKFLLITLCLFCMTGNLSNAYSYQDSQEELLREKQLIIKECQYDRTLTQEELKQALERQKNEIFSKYAEQARISGDKLEFVYYPNGIIKQAKFTPFITDNTIEIDYCDVYGNYVGSIIYQNNKIDKIIYKYPRTKTAVKSDNNRNYINNSRDISSSKFNQIGDSIARYNGDKISCIGDMPVYYNGDKISCIGNMPVYYNGDKISCIGNMQVRY